MKIPEETKSKGTGIHGLITNICLDHRNGSLASLAISPSEGEDRWLTDGKVAIRVSDPDLLIIKVRTSHLKPSKYTRTVNMSEFGPHKNKAFALKNPTLKMCEDEDAIVEQFELTCENLDGRCLVSSEKFLTVWDRCGAPPLIMTCGDKNDWVRKPLIIMDRGEWVGLVMPRLFAGEV